jgi:sulfite dehydrogenase (cytochrome) subunit B
VSSRSASRAVFGAIALALASLGAAGAQDKTVTLPPDHEYGRLKPGPGVDATRSRCLLCHSSDYIVSQPRGDAKQWEAIVNKMVRVYGAPVSEGEAKAIVEYLAAQYGPAR